MKDGQRVAWTEGMLMCPQHLQQQDLYHERVGAARLEAAMPYAWGVVDVQIDAGALGSGEVRIREFAGVLPDGTPLSFGPSDPDSPPARSIEGHFRPGQADAVEIFLGLPVEREGAPSFEDDERVRAQFPPRSRFTLAARLTKDLAGGARPTEIAFGRRNIVVLFGDEPREDFTTVKVGEVTRDGRGQLVLVDTFIPACLRISASPFINTSMSRMLNVLTGKHRELANQRRERDTSTVEFSGGDITRYLQLTAVGGLIPVFTHLTRLGDVSPRELYLMLAQAAGQLMSFSPDTDPTQLPPFIYTDLRSTFEELFAVLTSLLQSTVRESSIPVPLMIKNGVLFGRLDDPRVARCKSFVLAVKPEGVTEEEIVQRLGSLSKIASWNQIQSVVRSATPGVPIKITHRPPAEIPIKAGVVYFTIDTDNSYWKQVVDEHAIALYFPPPFDPTHLKTEMLAIAPRAE